MEGQSVEEGLLAKPERINGTTTTSCDCGCCGRDTASPPSSTTAVVVFSTLIATCGSFCYGFAYSVFASIMTIGGMLGALLSGKIAEVLGRRKAMWLSEIVCTLGWLAIAFAKDPLWLDLGRLFLGFGVGIISYVIPVYIAEITPKDIRGVFSAFNMLMSTLGFSLIFFIGNLFSWRILTLLGAIPCVLHLIGLFFIPESPRWLVKIGKEKDFEIALQQLRGKNADISEEAAEIRDHNEISQQHPEARFLDLFRRKYAKSLTIGVGLMLLQQFGGSNAMAYYASSIFEEADVSSTIGSRGTAIIEIPAVIAGVLLMDNAGRRPLLMISAGGMGFGSFLLGLSFCLKGVKNMNEATPILALVGFMGSALFNSLGMMGIPFIIMSEIFPINVKASAGSLVTLVSWSCSWIATYTFNFMMQWSSAGTFFIFTGICILAVVFVSKIVPETKGRTLEEIQDSISMSFP